MYDAIMAETIGLNGHGGDVIEGYLARPLGPGPFGSVVVIHHMPGYDAPTKEITRKFAANGYAALCPNLYTREAPGASPDDAAATARSRGGVPDDRLVGDVGGAASYLRSMPTSNGKAAFVVGTPPEGMPLKVGPILHLAKDLSCPLLGLFGAEDQHPSPEQTAELEKELTAQGKTYEFHTYEGAGHAFFAVDRPAYRPEAANDGWQRIWEWFGRYLAS
jgi:carboxymethylenebutenolidase